MALIACKECGSQVSSKANKCPQCGVDVPKGVSVGTVLKWGFVALAGYAVYSCTYVMNQADRDSRYAPTAEPVAAAVSAAAPPLKLLSWRCEKNRKYAYVKGEVRNMSSISLRNVMAVGTLRTEAGELIEAEDALLDLTTLMPGQSSAFEVMIEDNPLGTTCNLDFKTFGGTTIAHTWK